MAINTRETTPDEAVQEVLLRLEREGYIGVIRTQPCAVRAADGASSFALRQSILVCRPCSDRMGEIC